MSEYRNTNDPLRRDTPYDPNSRGGTGGWGWAAGAVLVVILLALAFGIGHAPNQTGPNVAANNTPTMNQQTPAPNGPASPAYTPAPSNPANPTPLSPTAPQSKP
jgi:hypothetical protein